MADVEIRLGGKVWRLRPVFGAMREIEAQCKSSCATLLQLLARHELHASEMTIIVYHGMLEAEGQERPSDYEAVGKRLFEVGIGSEEVRTAVADYLAELLHAPDDARKKAVGEWFREAEAITSQMFSPQPTRSDGDPETSGAPLPESSGRSSKPSVKNRKK